MRIRREDVETVRERSRIDEVIGEHVSLRPAGIGALKGLCPFHDEKTPSFNVRPTVGFYHCFGCGQGGDVISFVQEIDHLTFAEAVERLADRIGLELRYEDDGDGKRKDRGDVNQRRRLLEANRAAAQFYVEQLGTNPDASIGRQFLVDRGFDQAAAGHFGVGFAPRGGEVLTRHLQGRGFSGEDLIAAGLTGQGRRGLYDRFRGRLIWPIRDVTGDTLGFGARRLFDDDSIAAKYLNTPETVLYKKSHVLYGVDLAKRDIAKSHQVIVVEGYTDVMACHLAGEPTAVATCGTAFAADHIRIVRRLIGDERNSGGKVIFTFDGDAAGQAAALKAFEDDQRFVSQTYVSIAPSGMDPCELRQQQGNEAVKELIGSRRPMFEFKIESIVNEVDLTTVEGGARALRLAAPVVAGIRDEVIRRGYAVKLAGMLGMDDELVRTAVARAYRDLRSGSGGPDPRGRQGEYGRGSRPSGSGTSSGGPGGPGGAGQQNFDDGRSSRPSGPGTSGGGSVPGGFPGGPGPDGGRAGYPNGPGGGPGPGGRPGGQGNGPGGDGGRAVPGGPGDGYRRNGSPGGYPDEPGAGGSPDGLGGPGRDGRPGDPGGGYRRPGGDFRGGRRDDGSWQRGGNRRNAGPPGGIQQPDGSWLLPDGTYVLPPPEPKRDWKGKGGKGGGTWGERDRQRWNNGEGKTGFGGNGFQGGGYGWADQEPPPEEMPPPEDEPPYDDYDPGAGAGPAPRRFERPRLERPNPRDPVAAVERQALECLLQVPRLVPSVESDALPDNAFQVPLYRAIHEAIQGAGGMAVAVGMTPSAWVSLVQDFAPDPAVPMITELAVAPLPSTDDEVALAKYAAGIVLHIAEEQLGREIAGLKAAWQRGEDVGTQVMELEMRKRELGQRKHGVS